MQQLQMLKLQSAIFKEWKIKGSKWKMGVLTKRVIAVFFFANFCSRRGVSHSIVDWKLDTVILQGKKWKTRNLKNFSGTVFQRWGQISGSGGNKIPKTRSQHFVSRWGNRLENMGSIRTWLRQECHSGEEFCNICIRDKWSEN